MVSYPQLTNSTTFIGNKNSQIYMPNASSQMSLSASTNNLAAHDSLYREHSAHHSNLHHNTTAANNQPFIQF